MKTSIEINEKLVKQALELTQCKNNQELIEGALQELILTRKKRKNLLDLSERFSLQTIASTKLCGKTEMLLIDTSVWIDVFREQVRFQTDNN